MTALVTKPLTERFGVEVLNVDLSTVTADHLFSERFASPSRRTRPCCFGGKRSLRKIMCALPSFSGLWRTERQTRSRKGRLRIPEVSNVTKDGGVTDADDMHTLHLRANQLWHTDSTFLPTPALVNILIAHVVPSSGGNTELASTRAAWADMPPALKERVRNAVIWHRYSHSRARISEELAQRRCSTNGPTSPGRRSGPIRLRETRRSTSPRTRSRSTISMRAPAKR